MLRYAFKRLVALIPVLLGVALLIFTIMYFTPGDPARLQLGDQATEEQLATWREARDLDKPFVVQFAKYIWGIVSRADFGISYKTGKPVSTAILERFPTTFVLAMATCFVGMLVGILLGVVAANHQNTWIDSLARIFGIVGISMPNFWFALLLILIFAVRLRWFPVSGWYGPKYMVLPAVALGMAHAATLMRITRSSMLDCIRQDYVTTARAKGQKESVITRHHIFRNALIPILTAVGSAFGVALGGALITEQIFSIPGLGSLMVNAITNRDYPQVRGSVLLLAASYSLVNLLVDLLYAAVDPRIKAQYSGKKKKKKQPENVKPEAKEATVA